MTSIKIFEVSDTVRVWYGFGFGFTFTFRLTSISTIFRFVQSIWCLIWAGCSFSVLHFRFWMEPKYWHFWFLSLWIKMVHYVASNFLWSRGLWLLFSFKVLVEFTKGLDCVHLTPSSSLLPCFRREPLLDLWGYCWCW